MKSIVTNLFLDAIRDSVRFDLGWYSEKKTELLVFSTLQLIFNALLIFYVIYSGVNFRLIIFTT